MLASMIAMAGAVAVVLVCSYALIAGSWRERFGALVYLTAYLIVLGFGKASPLSMLMADTLCIPGFFIANWKSRHPWPRWALAGQLLSVSVEVVALLPKVRAAIDDPARPSLNPAKLAKALGASEENVFASLSELVRLGAGVFQTAGRSALVKEGEIARVSAEGLEA